jgi:hypothetical protein
MSRCVRFLAIASLLAGTLPAQTSDTRDIKLIRTVSDQLISWFESLSKSADQLADNEDEKRLKASFIALNKRIYSLEENGRTLLAKLGAKPLDQAAAQKAVADTRNALGELSKQLHITGLALRSQYRQGGADAEKLITDAMHRRDVFLGAAEAEIGTGHISHDLLQVGDSVLGTQRSASLSLIKVIDKMP